MSEMVLYQPGGGQSLTAPSSSPPAQVFPTRLATPGGGGSNWGIVAFLSLLALAILTLWRVHTHRLPTTKTGAVATSTKTVWSAVVLGILISLTTDLNKGLGAAVGFSIVLFILLKELGPFTSSGATGALATAGNAAIAGAGTAAPAPSASSTPGTSSLPTCPPGQIGGFDSSHNPICFTPLQPEAN